MTSCKTLVLFYVMNKVVSVMFYLRFQSNFHIWSDLPVLVYQWFQLDILRRCNGIFGGMVLYWVSVGKKIYPQNLTLHNALGERGVISLVLEQLSSSSFLLASRTYGNGGGIGRRYRVDSSRCKPLNLQNPSWFRAETPCRGFCLQNDENVPKVTGRPFLYTRP